VSGVGPSGSPLDEIEDADPALAKERTDLAWTRSSISFAALGVLLLKFRPAVGVPVILLSGVVWWLGHVRRDQAGTASRRVLVVTVAVTAMAFVALLIVVLGRGSHGLRL